MGGILELTFCDLRSKEIVNAVDGKRLGRILDLVFTLGGEVRGIVAPYGRKGLLFRTQEIFIPWKCIKKIGEDIILVELVDTFSHTCKDKRRKDRHGDYDGGYHHGINPRDFYIDGDHDDKHHDHKNHYDYCDGRHEGRGHDHHDDCHDQKPRHDHDCHDHGKHDKGCHDHGKHDKDCHDHGKYDKGCHDHGCFNDCHDHKGRHDHHEHKGNDCDHGGHHHHRDGFGCDGRCEKCMLFDCIHRWRRGEGIFVDDKKYK